jgi:hypothetical protein
MHDPLSQFCTILGICLSLCVLCILRRILAWNKIEAPKRHPSTRQTDKGTEKLRYEWPMVSSCALTPGLQNREQTRYLHNEVACN